MLLLFSGLLQRLPNSNTAEYVVGGITCFIILISLLGNLLVVVTIGKTKALQRMNAAWYISLAVADLGKASICMPIFVLLLLSDDWALTQQMCPIYHCFQMSLEIASILNLTAISLDRVFMITRPLTYQRTINLRKIIISIGLLWIVSFLFSFLQLLWWVDGGTEGSVWKDKLLHHLGLANLDCQYQPPPSMVIVDFCVGFVLPMSVMSVAYVKIFIVVHSQMRKIKRRQSELWDDSDGSNKYTQVPAITKSIDAMRSSTSEERLKCTMPSRGSFAVPQSELARITEVPHENCSSPAHCKECGRDRTSTNDSNKSKSDAANSNTAHANDISVTDMTQGEHIVAVATIVGVNSNNNARATGAPSAASAGRLQGSDMQVEDLENPGPGSDVPQVQSSSTENPRPKAERRSSLKKARASQDSMLSTKRASVQFQLYPEDSIAPEEETRPTINSKASKQRKIGKNSVVLDDETTTSEAVTTETWLSGSSAVTRQKKAQNTPSDEHTQVWASRHFSTSQDFSFSSGTRASIGADSSGSGQTWNSMLQRRRRSIQRIRENKAVKMTLIVVGAFMFCWLPLEITFMVKQFCNHCVTDTMWLSVTMVAFSASAINPFIYNFYSSEFRRAVKRVLCCEDNTVTPWM